MTENNTINVRSFNNWLNNWLWTVSGEAGSIVVQDVHGGFCFLENDELVAEAPTLLDLIEELDSSGYWSGLFEELSETFGDRGLF